jgi:hypothetical protein
MSFCFISEELEVIATMNSINEAKLSVYEQSQKKAVVARLIKLHPAVQLLRNKHYQGCGPAGYTCDVKARLDEDTVLIKDIPEPIIKSSYAI